jgi:glutamyl-tRNA reductase
MNWIEIITLVFSTVLGGSWLINLVTVKSQKKKAEAEAKKENAEADTVIIENEGKKLNNMQEFAELWKKLSEEKSQIDGEKIADLTKRMQHFETLALSFESLAKSLQKELGKLTKAITEAKKCPGAEKCPALLELNKND